MSCDFWVGGVRPTRHRSLGLSDTAPVSRFVIPAKAGIHGWVTGMPGMDSRLRGNDKRDALSVCPTRLRSRGLSDTAPPSRFVIPAKAGMTDPCELSLGKFIVHLHPSNFILAR
jgi:hypothetical protein